MEKLVAPIAKTLNITYAQVKNTLDLLADGNTIPFIARYRKEVTKDLDEEQIRYIDEQFQYQKNLAKRKEDVKRLIETQGKLTPELIENTAIHAIWKHFDPKINKRRKTFTRKL